MASKALSGWTAVFKELQRWNLHPPTAEQAASVVPRVNKLLAQLESLPPTAVEELLQDAQVLRAMGAFSDWHMVVFNGLHTPIIRHTASGAVLKG